MGRRKREDELLNKFDYKPYRYPGDFSTERLTRVARMCTTMQGVCSAMGLRWGRFVATMQAYPQLEIDIRYVWKRRSPHTFAKHQV
ncbi:MAG: hypothetical protein KDJ47_17050 [Hyphomicrobiaceae bacterium]|nr:hypothetical protein [Hyphomicrobiaceae bacterium]